MFFNEKNIDLTNIPPETLTRICSFLDYRSLKRVSASCTILRDIFTVQIEPTFKTKQKKFTKLVQAGQIDLAISYIKENAFPTNYPVFIQERYKPIETSTVLHILCDQFKIDKNNEKHIELFHLILKSNAYIDAIRSKPIIHLHSFNGFYYIKQTLLIDAIRAEKKDLFDLLIDNGADVNLGVIPFNIPLALAIDKQDLHYLFRLLEKNVTIESTILEFVKDRTIDLTWQLIYLHMLKAYILQQGFSPNSEAGEVANVYCDRIDQLYGERKIRYDAGNYDADELLPFQMEVVSMQSKIFTFVRPCEEDQLEEEESPETKPKKAKI